MACQDKYIEIMNNVIDGDGTPDETTFLNKHLETCATCQEHFQDLKMIDQNLHQRELEEPSDNFTASVMSHIQPRKKQNRWIQWMKYHPMVSAAAVFLVLMTGYIFSAWSQAPFEAYVQGGEQMGIQYKEADNTVIVPEGQVIRGDLVVKNGKVKILGKVDGNVILIKSEKLRASAGSVTGEIEEVNQVLEWMWFHIKGYYNKVFIAVP